MRSGAQALTGVAELLLPWFGENARVLPWRSDPTPYHVWVSEIMLQQTRVEAVKSYYERFMSELPDIEALAYCPEDKLMKLWEGLGYYSRVRNLQKAALQIVEEMNGDVPDTREALLKLPGIGPYTSGAIASIAFDRKVPAVDGNVLRVWSRLVGSRRNISEPAVRKEIEAEILEVMPEKGAGAFNQGMMEIGAMVCLPNGKPQCEVCPFAGICRARLEDLIDKIPVKDKKKDRRTEDRTVLIIRDGLHVLLHKRADKGLLAGLYELPNLDGHADEKAVLDWVKERGLLPVRIQDAGSGKHIFTHIEWHMKGYTVLVEDLDAYVRDEKEKYEPGTFLAANRKDAAEKYSIPSAFKTFARQIIPDMKQK